MSLIRAVAAVSAIAYASASFGYETDTHARIASHAFERSVLATPELASRLGLNRFDDESTGVEDPAQPFFIPNYISYNGKRSAYLDFTQTNWDGAFSLLRRRTPQLFDSINMYSGPGEDFRGDSEGERFGFDHLRTKAWLMRGAIREDDIPPSYLIFELLQPPLPDPDPDGEIFRVFRHFYDPIRDTPLDVFSACSVESCVRSPDWAFGQAQVAGAAPQPPDPNRRNHFTWADAREAQWCALTRNAGSPITNANQNAADRRLCWATTIKSLGHVLHLLQDVAQPQHVRNDIHTPGFSTPARQSFEQWTNFRAADERVGTAPNPDGLRFMTMIGPDPNTPLVVGLSYPIPTFARPVHYFTTRQVETGTAPAALLTRRGLADLTNRSFFSEGTILSADYELPPSDAQSPAFEYMDRVLASDPAAGQLTERLILSPLVDPLRGTYVDNVLAPFNGKVPVAALGLWADFSTGASTEIYQSLSLSTQTTHADVLIPRAIAYSAGLIDYFFRGKLEVTPPLDGLFSVIDHATPHTTGSFGYPFRIDNGNIFGFTRVRARVRNATPDVNESGITPAVLVPRDMPATSLPGGTGVPTMRAVARYHRNPCYQPNLSGERQVDFAGVVTEPAGCADGTRTPFQEISVSLAVATDAAQINGPGQDLVFDFSQQPIPVNATDMVIQVVYRGPLGLESDAIAVGSLDIREPTYVTLWNNTDYAGCSGNWAAQGMTPPGCIVEGSGAQRSILTTRICIGTQQVYEHLDNPHGSLLVGNYVRLAALLSDQPRATRSRSIVLNISTIEIRNRSITGDVRQSDKEELTAQAPFESNPLWRKRGYVGSFRPLPYYQINGADPQPASDMGPLDVGALTNAIVVPLVPDPGNIVFPLVATSNMGCTIGGTAPMFDDEAAHVAGFGGG